MNKAQTDNSYFMDKVMLRYNFLPDKPVLNVLDCYAGESLIWNKIKLMSNKQITVTSIDLKFPKKMFILKGDNIKFLRNMNIDKYDIIDLDSYGVPYLQLKHVLNRKYSSSKIIFITYIQSVYGCLNKGMLSELGYTKEMVNKCPTLFFFNGFGKLKDWLSLYGINEIVYKQEGKKNYCMIKTKSGE